MAFRDPHSNAILAPNPYSAPGFSNDLDEALLTKWNDLILLHYKRLATNYGSRFFEIDPRKVNNGGETDAVKWSADPAEPKFCYDRETAKRLSDWATTDGHPIHEAFGSTGRRRFHNEYCEYVVKYVIDEKEKRVRPKRVIITTELREYWLMLAEHSPSTLEKVASSILRRNVSCQELYGPAVSEPNSLTAEQRKILFSTWVAGGEYDRKMLQLGVPRQPLGDLNNQNALFMTHPINGLDDLLYIVMFGAHPYAKRKGNKWVPATKDEIFKKFGVEQLACRHADPAAAIGAQGVALKGNTLAFANPLGMYIRSFAQNNFLFKGESVPDSWIRWSRGKAKGYFQRLEFGPSDSEPYFLSDITVGDKEEKLVGGFQVLEQIEVGPLLLVGDGSSVTKEEYEKSKVTGSFTSISCAEAEICQRIKTDVLAFEYAKLRDEKRKIKFE